MAAVVQGGGGVGGPGAGQVGPDSEAVVVPRASRRVRGTDAPIVTLTKSIIEGAAGERGGDVLSLAQGVVHWAPPGAALRAAARAVAQAQGADRAAAARVNGYGATRGSPELRSALQRKLSREHGLEGYEPVVTPGANCACLLAMLALADADDAVVLFPPVSISHERSLSSCAVRTDL